MLLKKRAQKTAVTHWIMWVFPGWNLNREACRNKPLMTTHRATLTKSGTRQASKVFSTENYSLMKKCHNFWELWSRWDWYKRHKWTGTNAQATCMNLKSLRIRCSDIPGSSYWSTRPSRFYRTYLKCGSFSIINKFEIFQSSSIVGREVHKIRMELFAVRAVQQWNYYLGIWL